MVSGGLAALVCSTAAYFGIDYIDTNPGSVTRGLYQFVHNYGPLLQLGTVGTGFGGLYALIKGAIRDPTQTPEQEANTTTTS